MEGQTTKPTTKPLRFVTNYGAPHPKRRRIGAACLTCRKRKTACSGERPYCETCKQNKLECAGYASDTVAALEATSRKQQDINSVRHHIDPALQNDGPTISGSQQNAFSQNSSLVSKGADQPRDSLFSGPRNRMPYFRWLGPTAIMPGFKQMVVKVKRQDDEAGTSSADAVPLISPPDRQTDSNSHSIHGFASTSADGDGRAPLNLPFYDTSAVPPSELITHLAQTFFKHLACNFPFLQRDRFLRDLEEKQVDAILVDAVCALAARFSTHQLLVSQQVNDESKPSPAEYGTAFAHRAKIALTDTFACPTVAVVQAALLIAYNEFGESRDSGLWVYLGIAIRMAQDLGMHKIQGLKYRGTTGPTPKMVKMESRNSTLTPATRASTETTSDNEQEIEEQKAVEQERVDTFWAIFFLDRVVSSGTGRRSTLRDKDIELSFPLLSEQESVSGWPAPFPALIRIIHLYGRVVDLLNGIKEPSDITNDTPKRLAAMESQVTHLYQGLSTKLHFDAVNFQHYVKAGEGTNFVLLHFWFHTLIVLLHQPTLLKTFEGRMLQLFPNSQQLSMSSAKTIADILSYSQLIDAKACLGNPFTTQPIYIAACAFLKESAEHSATSNAHSRAASPQRQVVTELETAQALPRGDQKAIAKHTLLATAAAQHYQLCLKALQLVEVYWSGTKYIVTVLEQKYEGVGDPVLYTAEEGERAMETPRTVPSFKVPGWRRTLSFSQATSDLNMPRVAFTSRFWEGLKPSERGASASKAIGWTLTGNMDSPSTNLAWHYPSGRTDEQTLDMPPAAALQPLRLNHGAAAQYPISSSDVSDASLLLGLHTPFEPSPPPNTHQQFPLTDGSAQTPAVSHDRFPMEGMMIEQQDIDTNMLGLDMMPWFDPTYGINNDDILALYHSGHLQDQSQPRQDGTTGGALPHG